MKKIMYSLILAIAFLTPQKARGWDGKFAGGGTDIAGVLIMTGVIGGVVLTLIGYKICQALYKQTIAAPDSKGN